MTYAKAYQDISGNKWRVTPKVSGFHGLYDRDEAMQIARALNEAYHAGRATLQSELRDLLGAARDEQT